MRREVHVVIYFMLVKIKNNPMMENGHGTRLESQYEHKKGAKYSKLHIAVDVGLIKICPTLLRQNRAKESCCSHST